MGICRNLAKCNKNKRLQLFGIKINSLKVPGAIKAPNEKITYMIIQL